VISDIHLSPFGRAGRSKFAATYGSDTNPALLESLITELTRTEPDPPVIFIAGDFLGHGFPVARAARTMTDLARRFDRAYPHAQFVITLGNNDSGCGDYEESLDSPFLRATARAWAPLVDRNGAAPDFVRTFSHDGSYVARLPRAGLRAVVVNDVYDALRYRNVCGAGNPAATSLHDLAKILTAQPKRERTWLVTHIPPGIDAFSTAHLAHRILIVPFMRPGPRERLVDLIDDPKNRVALVIAGHTHHFSFRLSDARHTDRDVPILIAPSVSPIFRNAPAFLTLDVAPDGIVRNVAETSYLDGRWGRVGDLAGQGVAALTPSQLLRYVDRLVREPSLRNAYIRLDVGGAAPEIDARSWPVYRCAMTQLSASGLRACADEGGWSVFTHRGFVVAGIALATFVTFVVACIAAAALQRRASAAGRR
jgi:hypothetical protein